MRLTAGLCPALTEEVMSKLKGAGIKNVIDFMLKDSESLALETSISYKDLQSIRRIIHAHHAAFAVTGTDLLNETVRSSVIISTGNQSLNSLLGGGLMTGEVVEVCGAWGTGKTSLCVQLALHAALNLGVHTLYIDTNASVSPSRLSPYIEQLSDSDGANLVEKALSRIKVTSPQDIWGLFQILEMTYRPNITLEDNVGSSNGSQSRGKLKLVIIDSLPTIAMPLLDGTQKQGLGILNQLALTLKSLATEQHIAVVVVNNVVQANDGRSSIHKPENIYKWKPALGRYWSHVPNTRLFVERVEPPELNRSTSLLEPREDQASSQTSLVLKVSVWKSTRLKMDSSQFSLFA